MKKHQDSKDADHSILQRLKTATASQHSQVERCFKILDPHLSLDQYIDWLARLYGYYEPFEHMIEPWSSEIAINWSGRCKTPLLIRDLARLGVTEERITSLPICHSLPVLTNIGSLFGALYVFEGSTLGGCFIANHLANILKLDAENGMGFFLPYGFDPKPQWLAFQSRLCEVAASDFHENQIILAAKETFGSFNAWLAGF
jgi:heme oxygenase